MLHLCLVFCNDYVYLEEGVCLFRHWSSGYLAPFRLIKIKYFSLAFVRSYRVFDEALIAETAERPIFFLIDIITALKGSLFLFYLIARQFMKENPTFFVFQEW